MPSDGSPTSSAANGSRVASLIAATRELPRSAWFLVAANAMPLLGVLFFGWDLVDILLLFWAESAVVGVFNVLKMLSKGTWANLFFVPFFCLHYGGFMLGHLVFLVAFYIPFGTGGDLDAESLLARVRGLAPAVLALFVSHGASFWLNFLRGGERERADHGKLFAAPYGRIVIMHLTIIFGAFLVMLVGSPTPALIVLLALKTGVDLVAHARERKKMVVSGAHLANKSK